MVRSELLHEAATYCYIDIMVGLQKTPHLLGFRPIIGRLAERVSVNPH